MRAHVSFVLSRVDGDDGPPHQACAGDCRVTHTAAPDHRHGVVTTDGTGVDSCADTCHDAAAQQTRHGGIGFVVDLVHWAS